MLKPQVHAMTWRGTGTSCVAFTTLASNSGMCGTIRRATSALSGTPQSHIVAASTCIFLTLSIYSEFVLWCFVTFTGL